jgi:thiol-disulfide isomerase/thioredoxin
MVVGGKQTKKAAKQGKSRSVMGRLMPPVDIRGESQLAELEKRIKAGPLTLVLVYADWCGHCTEFKPTMEQLETTPGRTIQTARVRDDMFPKSSLSNTTIEGYPTLMLVKKNGEATAFKKSSGEVTNAIPDHTDVNKMKIIVRNAGTPEGQALLTQGGPRTNEDIMNMKPLSTYTVSERNVIAGEPSTNIPRNILADRLDSGVVATQNTVLANSKQATLKGAVAPAIGGRQAGGSLFSQLTMAAQQLAPAAALFLASAASTKHRRSSRRTRRRTTRRRFTK